MCVGKPNEANSLGEKQTFQLNSININDKNELAKSEREKVLMKI